ncbi:phosphoenolpyruvate--protein phosphotransferase [Acidihalobacter ferrooxydans]|uniref:phosphoenolpyruvate--protein phosphotransferase n=1 Tax=Acidihalobacter ferrooxydans TaxID=1765967 RepID=A0A1P8UE93_9GAMM|nr:phosphoenolpyruvate--protein phosphotransferase [Acidihalobacter ferrooxydans]APZ42182.1 phosphoenolpyruvate--protein phosphotransferase [Acidihalobacter ferrooxydans]
MLKTLQRIVEEVGSAASMSDALAILVANIRTALKVNVCSVYLVMPGSEHLVLMATEGLNATAVGKVRLSFEEGLVGLVAQRAEPVNLDDAPQHARYRYFPETGEQRYHAFLGVPIIHQRRVLGVLVVQKRARRGFGESAVAFLSTLAVQVAVAIRQAELSGEIQRLLRGELPTDLIIRGLGGSPGVAIGTARVVYAQADLEKVPDRSADDIEEEIAAFEHAVEDVREELAQIRQRMVRALPAEEQTLFDAYAMMLDSDHLIGGTVQRIEEGAWAPTALRDTVRKYARTFEEMDDAYLRERAADIRDLGRRILSQLLAQERGETPYRENTVLIGDDVSASQLAEVPPECLIGVVSARGSSSSHVAILARALGIPAVMGAENLPVGRLDGREVIVDGYGGRLFVQPGRQVRREFTRLAREERELARDLSGLASKPAITLDGVTLPIYVNSGLLADVEPALKSGAEGVGLYRTEFPYMVRDRFPSEEEQIPTYRQMLQAFHPRPVTLRTLDIGGDKPLAYFPVREDNPFLGWRGIRITLDHPELFLTQTRAMLRASDGLDNLRILFPMISNVAEVDEANELLTRARDELLEEGASIGVPQRGVMIEVPSAVYLAEALARRVDYLSVGTNDLVQYLLAVDRNNTRVASLYHPLHPAVLQALQQACEGAHRAGKPIYVCGEMAGDPAAVILLLGMGYDALSVSVAGLTRVKWVIRSFTRVRARALFEEALRLEDPLHVRELLDDALIEAGLGGLVRPGKR